MITTYSSQILKSIKDIILNGGVISFPTDTLYALSCNASNDAAIKKLFGIKQRNIDKTAPIFFKNFQDVMQYAYVNENQNKLAEAFWPGPLTMVLNVKPQTKLSELSIRNSTIAVRIPNSQIALEILNECNVPLLATSANLSDGPNLVNAQQIEDSFGQKIDLIIDSPAVMPSGQASTIVTFKNDVVKILRPGMVTEEEILKVLT